MKTAAAIILICLTLILGPGFALSQQSDASKPLKTISLNIDRQTTFTLEKGDNAGELILDINNYPEDVLQQLEKQLDKHFAAMQVISFSPEFLQIKLIILPINFHLQTSRFVQPHRLEIRVFRMADSGSVTVQNEIPASPMWEMLVDEAPLLPPSPYGDVKGSSEAFENYKACVELFSIGAYDAALKKLGDTLKSSPTEFWEEGLMLYAEILFHSAIAQKHSFLEARRSLLIAEQENVNQKWKSRAALLLAYLSLIEGDAKGASKLFTNGVENYPAMGQYFLIGITLAKIKQGNVPAAKEILNRLSESKGVSQAVGAKACFVGAMLVLLDGGVDKANENIDSCIEQYAPEKKLSAEQLLILSEARLLSGRYGEAKTFLNRFMREFPDHPKVSLGSLRYGDVLFFEGLNQESAKQYNFTAQHWRDSPYARLAFLRGREVELRKLGQKDLYNIYLELDLLHEPYVVDREAKLRLVWLFDAAGLDDKAYVYLIEMVKRYDGLKYWNFHPKRLSKIVSNHYKHLYDSHKYLTMIRHWQAKIELPLSPEEQDDITLLVVEAFKRLNQPKEAVRVYQNGLETKKNSVSGERKILLGLTQAYVDLGDYYRAERTQEYFHSRFKDPEDQYVHFLFLADINEKQKNLVKALDALENAMKFAENRLDRQKIAFRLSRILYKQNNYAKTIEVLKPILQYFLDPKSTLDGSVIAPSIRYSIFIYADSLFKEGDFEQSYRVFLRAAQLFPSAENRPIAEYFAALSAEKLGRKEEAASLFAQMEERPEPFWKQLAKMKNESAQWYSKHRLAPQPE